MMLIAEALIAAGMVGEKLASSAKCAKHYQVPYPDRSSAVNSGDTTHDIMDS